MSTDEVAIPVKRSGIALDGVSNNVEAAIPVEVSDTALDSVSSNVESAALNLKKATCALRVCYMDGDGDNPQYKALRRSVTNNAIIYKDQIQPLSQNVIQNLQDFFSNYSDLTFEEFKESISDIARDAHIYRLQAELVARIHNAILLEFKKVDSQAEEVIKNLKLDMMKFTQDYKKHQKTASDASDKTRYFQYAALLIFTPNPITFTIGVGALIVSCCTAKFQTEAEAKAVAANENANVVEFAAGTIEGPLTRSLKEFVMAMTEIAGFFSILESEISLYARDSDKAKDAATNRHYKKMKTKSVTIQNSCRYYLSILPIVKTDLDSIETKDIDQNYVQKWLTETMVKINGEEKSFVDWVLEILPEVKGKLLECLTALEKNIFW